MKTEMTRTIEQAIVEWNPAQIGDIKVNKFRAHHTGLEVPAECGTTTGGIVDAVRVSEYFGDIITTTSAEWDAGKPEQEVTYNARTERRSKASRSANITAADGIASAERERRRYL